MLETRLTRGSCTSSWDPGVFESRAERLPVCAHGFRELIVCFGKPPRSRCQSSLRTSVGGVQCSANRGTGQTLVAAVAKTCRLGLAWDPVIKPLLRPTTSAPYVSWLGMVPWHG